VRLRKAAILLAKFFASDQWEANAPQIPEPSTWRGDERQNQNSPKRGRMSLMLQYLGFTLGAVLR
jgi:hypothetical protein